MLNFNKISTITNGHIILFNNDTLIGELIIDSRKISVPENALFFAIKGPRHDGHMFIKDAYEKGVRNFVIEDELFVNHLNWKDANVIKVTSSVCALQSLVTFHRNSFKIPVIGITGSNGKTIIKEWLYQLLNNHYIIVKNHKSFNSQVGVPLSVWEMNQSHTLGIFEAGISQPQEMEKLEKIIQPTIGIFSNIGSAHDEGFENTRQKIQEKLKLFKESEILFYCKDHELIHEEIIKSNYGFLTFSWTIGGKDADVVVNKIEKEKDFAKLYLLHNNVNVEILLSFSDQASIENLIHCISIMLYFKIEIEEIQQRLNKISPVAMRLELKEGINNCYVIDDSYNNDLVGLSSALNFLRMQTKAEKKTVILSEILESGLEEASLYGRIASLLSANGVEKFIGIGPVFRKYIHLFPKAIVFDDAQKFISEFNINSFSMETILVKGARVFELEKIVHALQHSIHGTVLYINLDALAHNLNFYRSLLKPTTKVMVMVKAFAYGNGSYEVANLLKYHRVDYLGVAYVDEGATLRDQGITMPVMVMNPSSDSFSKMETYQLEPEIYSFKILQEYISYLQLKNIKGRIHLKIDTGMRRLGFEEEQVDDLIKILKSENNIEIVSVFTHLAASDSEDHREFTMHQFQTYKRIVDKIDSILNIKVIRHGLNSAGIVSYPEWQMDMVRLGIGLYGVESKGQKQSYLQEVGTLKTVISQIKTVAKGATVGYSRRGVVARDSKIATIAIGYADGYSRRFGNGVGKVSINGKMCPTIGSVCMDMTMVDITDVQAKEGDEVMIFGKELPVSDLAVAIGTIPYEILTGVSERVKRIFYTE